MIREKVLVWLHRIAGPLRSVPDRA